MQFCLVENNLTVLFSLSASAGWPIESVSENVIQFGYEQYELISNRVPYSSIIYPQDLERVVSEMERFASFSVDNQRLEYRIVAKGGEVRWVEDRRMAERDDSGKVKRYRSVVLDITERKRVEETLCFTQFAVDNASSLIAWSTSEGRFFYVNDAACRSLRYSNEEFLAMSIRDIVTEMSAESYAEHWSELRKKGHLIFETKIRRKDGSIFPIEVNANYFPFAGKEYCCLFASDITMRKNDEERLRDSLTEKTVLLKEVHHRVKNNLQIISALLDLQSDTIASEQYRSYFQNSQERIRSMALVHEQLYRSGDLASINFSDYVESLVNYLFDSYVKDRSRISMRLDIDSMLLDIDMSIHCGLILNELISNALKHAFPDGLDGVITICLKAGTNGWITLSVSDTGVGYPPGMDIMNASTLGLQIVSMLVTQLHGQLETRNGKGASCVVRFNIPT